MIVMKKICLVFLLWILVVCGIFIFLLSTNLGVYLTLIVFKCYIPGLTFASVSGNWSNLNINHVVYQTSVGSIGIDRCHISVDLKHIWNKTLYIDRFFLKDILIKIDRIDIIDKEKEILKNSNKRIIFPVPVSMIFKNIVLHNTRVISKNIFVELKKIDAGVILQDNSLIISPACMKGVVLNIFDVDIAHIKSNIVNIYAHNNQWDIKYVLRFLSDKLLTILPSCNFLYDVILKDIRGENFSIIGNNYDHYSINNFCLQTYLSNYVVNIKCGITIPHGCFSIISNIILKEYYPIDITVTYISRNSNTKKGTNSIVRENINNVHLIINGALYKEIFLRCDFLGTISTAHISLTINLTEFSVPIRISVVGRKIPLSLFGKNDYLVEEIDFSYNGDMQNYCFQVTSRLSSKKFFPVYIIMYAQGDINSCVISKLRISMLDGYLDMQGVINWGDVISWRNVFLINKINLLQKWLKYPAQFSGNIITEGFISSHSWEITISSLDINGHIANNSISCTGGNLCSNSLGDWIIPKLLVTWGSNVLEIQGELKKDLLLHIILKAPNCNVIVPGLSGSIHGKFKLYGPITYPKLLLNIDMRSLFWSDKNINFNRVIISSNMYCNDIMNSKFYLQADDIRVKNLLLHQLIINGQGSITQHYFNVIARGDMLFGKMKLSGNLDVFHKIWHGKIDKTSIITPIGTWKLMQDIIFTYQHLKRKITIDSHYWDITNCTIVVPNMLKINILDRIDEVFKNFNMIPVKILLPEFITVQTVSLHCSNCYWILGTLFPEGIISFVGNQVNVSPCSSDEKVASINISNVRTDFILTPTTLHCKWFINIDHDNKSSGLLKIIMLRDTFEILGNIHIQNNSLSSFWNSLILLKDLPVNGLLSLNVCFHKYAHYLKIYGFSQLQHISINIPNVPFPIKNGQLLIRFFGDYAILSGTIDTDYKCRLYLNGDITDFSSIHNMRACLQIRGEQINFCIFPEIKAKISPNIMCTITSKMINLQGNVDIPWAYIKPKDFARNIIRISAEEILLDDDFNPILDNSKNLDMPIFGNITVCFGNNVIFDGLGLNAKLKGNLEIGYYKNNLVLKGHINMPSGYFQMYGQNLIIKKGQLLFSGAINQPYIDIEAICDPSRFKNGIIVGLRVTGVFDRLKLETFSNSSLLSSQEIMYYLLGNKNLIFSKTLDTNIIASLLIGVSAQYSEKFVNKIGNLFGVQDLELNAQDVGTTSLIALSGYIAPGLRIEYGVNIFDLLTTITVRYRLCPQLYLEVKSGSNQAFDILYKFNF